MKDWLKQLILKFEWIDSLIGFIGIVILLLSSLFVQFFMKESPCPLCILQRAAFINIGICLIMNLRYKNRVSHWAMAILSACAGAVVSIRQILLHINDSIGYGSPFLGLHMYTWCFIVYSAVIIGSSIMLIIYPENNNEKCYKSS